MNRYLDEECKEAGCMRDDGECTHVHEGDEHAVAQVMVRDLFLKNVTGIKDGVTSAQKSERECLSPDLMEKRKGGDGVSTHVSKSQAMRAVVTTKSDESLHPIIRMGWKPLCNVTCNGMNGIFWGGHDRDVYVQCTSPPYAGLPLVDVAYGGCMMTCSHFERISGRELSKKWKESIHVVMPHTDSSGSQKAGQKMTMYKWLKEQAECNEVYGHGIVGKKIWICWFADARFYQGTVIEYKKASGKHVVQYTAGRVTEDLHLPLEKIDMGLTEPPVPCNPHADGLPMHSNKVIVSNPIWNQNSDVSLNIALEELQNSPIYAPTARGVVRPRSHMHEEESLLPSSERCIKIKAADTYVDSPDLGTIQKKRIPPPPCDADPSVSLQHASLKWMHHIAMELEDDIQKAYTSIITKSSHVHPATTFQVLLALATPAQRMGIFIALAELYAFHNMGASDMAVHECRQKLAYMIAVCSMKQWDG